MLKMKHPFVCAVYHGTILHKVVVAKSPARLRCTLQNCVTENRGGGEGKEELSTGESEESTGGSDESKERVFKYDYSGEVEVLMRKAVEEERRL